MEKPQQSNNMILGVVIGVLVCIIAFGGYYLLNRDSFFKMKESTDSIEQNSNSKEEAPDKKSTSDSYKVLSGGYAASAVTVILYNKEVYLSIDTCSLPDNTFKYYCDKVQNLTSSYKEYSFGNLTYEGIGASTYRKLNSKFLGIKLNINDVTSVYSVNQGQAISPAYQGFAFVKSDGSLSIISYNDFLNGNFSPKMISELSNIERVENKNGGMNGIETFAIDKNQQSYNLFSYFR